MGLFWRSKHEIAPETGKKVFPKTFSSGSSTQNKHCFTSSLVNGHATDKESLTHDYKLQAISGRISDCAHVTFFSSVLTKLVKKTVEFTIKRLKYVICNIIIIIYMKNKKERKERKNVHHSPLQEKNERRSQEIFFLGKSPGDEVAEKHWGEWVQLWTLTSGVVWVDNR